VSLKLSAALCLCVPALFVGCGGEDSTTTIIQEAPGTETVTTAPPEPPPDPVPPMPPPQEGVVVNNPTPDDYHRSLRVWPVFSSETKYELAVLFLKNNPTDCAALRRIEDAPIGLRAAVEEASTDPARQDDRISDAMLEYCETFVG